MEILDYGRLEFEVVKSKLENRDGSKRQEILRDVFQSEEVETTFKIQESDKYGKNIYSVMADGRKIGEISEADREVFELNIQNGTAAELNLHENLDDSGERVYTAKAVLCVPYVVMPNTEERVKKRGYAVMLAVILLAANALICAFRSDWVGLGLSAVAAIAIYYWAFIKKSGRVYDYIFKKERKINNMF